MAHHLILGHSDVLAMWAARRIPHVGEAGFGPCQAIGVASGPGDDDKLLAVVVFHDWQPACGTLQCTVAAASPRWASRGALQALFAYGFEQCGARKLWTCTPLGPGLNKAQAAMSKRALKFNAGIGFRSEATLREHFGRGIHAEICGFMRSEYQRSRWHVQVPAKEAA